MGEAPPPLAFRPERVPAVLATITPQADLPAEVPIGWEEVVMDNLDSLHAHTGRPERRMPPSARRRFEALVRAGTVGGLAAPSAKVAPNQTFHAWLPRLTVRWERKRDRYQVDAAHGCKLAGGDHDHRL